MTNENDNHSHNPLLQQIGEILQTGDQESAEILWREYQSSTDLPEMLAQLWDALGYEHDKEIDKLLWDSWRYAWLRLPKPIQNGLIPELYCQNEQQQRWCAGVQHD